MMAVAPAITGVDFDCGGGGAVVGLQGTGRAADLIAECLEIYEEGLSRTGSDGPDEEDVAVLLREQVPTARVCYACVRALYTKPRIRFT
jgi:hypothetical protein